MKDLFPTYYSASETQPDWEADLFAFDANVLLNLFGLSKEATEVWFEGLEKLGDRIFLPYQAASEFHKHLLDKPALVIKDTEVDLFDCFNQIKNKLEQNLQHHNPLNNSKQIQDARQSCLAQIKACEATLNTEFERWKADYSKDCNAVKERLAGLFTGTKIGTAPTSQQIRDWCARGADRYSQNIPPGFKDADKKEGNKYGDLFIWYELMQLARERNVGVVLFTYEEKSDWFHKDAKKTRKELKHEFLVETGHAFDAVAASKFYAWLGKGSPESKKEVENVGRRFEETLSVGDHIVAGVENFRRKRRTMLVTLVTIESNLRDKLVKIAEGFQLDRIEETSSLRLCETLISEFGYELHSTHFLLSMIDKTVREEQWIPIENQVSSFYKKSMDELSQYS